MRAWPHVCLPCPLLPSPRVPARCALLEHDAGLACSSSRIFTPTLAKICAVKREGATTSIDRLHSAREEHTAHSTLHRDSAIHDTTTSTVASGVVEGRAALLLPHLRVSPVERQQLLVRALLHHHPTLQHHHLVALPRRGQPVRDEDGRAPGRQPLERLKDLRLRSPPVYVLYGPAQTLQSQRTRAVRIALHPWRKIFDDTRLAL